MAARAGAHYAMKKWYPWLTTPYRQILTRYQQERGPHALLLSSQEGNGEASLCYALSRWLICRQLDGIKSCGFCHSCRLMMAGNHPDFYQPEPEKGLRSLGVDSIRAIIDSLYFRANQGGVKVVLLLHSELLTEQAANALLKILEEPPDDTYFLLVCQEPLRLLPTIKSRCLYWPLLVPDEALVVPWLKKIVNHNADTARTALRLCSGAPLTAEFLLQPARWHQRLALCASLSAAITSGDMLSLLPALNHDEDDGPLHWLLTLITDALKWQQGAQAFLINDDKPLLVSALAIRWTASVLHTQWQQWLHYLWQRQEVSSINNELFIIHQLLNWEQGLVNACAQF
ncbi:DNA polymerase III subunit delta' [Candidatus Hoaglandella endobia]|uniref:DNA polymerase III subunit delta' n=1 Tax=Candidatus Hoaglandella endobia TaxID=1778263 RepID=A0A143WTN7_9ENTR|nr:DNA polymerase III subunit delta' [Candidatus Hoaglandella endobia]CUX97211.1 DNA polymerase III subunit delta' [Candidatus Hoaglandella endobia]